MHIRGSPFSVVAKLLIQMLGTPMKIIENLSRPWGVAVRNSCCSRLQSGEIVVAENEHHCVLVFTKNGKVRIFRTKGSAQGQFNLPRGVAFDGTGDILVVDNHALYSEVHSRRKTSHSSWYRRLWTTEIYSSYWYHAVSTLQTRKCMSVVKETTSSKT